MIVLFIKVIAYSIFAATLYWCYHEDVRAYLNGGEVNYWLEEDQDLHDLHDLHDVLDLYDSSNVLVLNDSNSNGLDDLLEQPVVLDLPYSNSSGLRDSLGRLVEQLIDLPVERSLNRSLRRAGQSVDSPVVYSLDCSLVGLAEA